MDCQKYWGRRINRPGRHLWTLFLSKSLAKIEIMVVVFEPSDVWVFFELHFYLNRAVRIFFGPKIEARFDLSTEEGRQP